MTDTTTDTTTPAHRLARTRAERAGADYRLTIEAEDGQALTVVATQAQVDRLVGDLDQLAGNDGVRSNSVTGVQPT